MKFGKWLVILLLWIVLGFISLKATYAACQDNAASSSCSNQSHDCGDNLGMAPGNNPGYCSAAFPGSCYDVVPSGMGEYMTICYPAKNQPTPSPAPCGALNQDCCGMGAGCDDELVPQNISSGGVTTCKCINEDNPLPTAMPNPTTAPPLNNRRDDGMFCEVGGKQGVATALGCIPVEAKAFTSWILSIMFGIGGGIAFLLMIYGFVVIMTSNGDPKKVQGGKETITSAVTGLLVIIFAVFLLRLIAYDILRLPGILR